MIFGDYSPIQIVRRDHGRKVTRYSLGLGDCSLRRAHSATAHRGWYEWPSCLGLASPVAFPAKLCPTPLGNPIEGVERGLPISMQTQPRDLNVSLYGFPPESICAEGYVMKATPSAKLKEIKVVAERSRQSDLLMHHVLSIHIIEYPDVSRCLNHGQHKAIGSK